MDSAEESAVCSWVDGRGAGAWKLALWILRKNPLFVLVRGYRDIFLDGRAPEFGPLWKLWLVGVLACVLGYAWFHKLRKSFADVI